MVLIQIGLLLTLGSLISYSLIVRRAVQSVQTIASMLPLANTVLVLFFIGTFLVLYGLHQALRIAARNESFDGHVPWLSVIGETVESRRSSILGVTAGIVYAIAYAIVSGTIVYHPELSFSQTYLATIPSIVVVTCCDPLGQTPQAVAYLTEHLGLLIIPMNVALLVAVSWLAGMNFALAARALSLGARNWVTGFGATTGLFTACPTCAGLYLAAAVEGSSQWALLFVPVQSALILASLALLGTNLVIMARTLSRPSSCELKSRLN